MQQGSHLGRETSSFELMDRPRCSPAGKGDREPVVPVQVTCLSVGS